MPGLTLFTASQPLLSAALVISTPAPAPAMLDVAPLAWSLAAAQVALPDGPPDEAAPPPPGDNDGAGEPPINEIVVEGTYGPPKSDPAERINEQSYRVSQAVDQILVEPLAYAYRDGLPSPIRDGLGNVVRNLGEPTNALNFLLQGKVGKAFETLGRLAINSTIGVGGLIDVAGKSNIALPYRRNGFANTLGFYGVGPGPYLFLPLTGPTTVRDQIGITLDQALLPFVVGKPFNTTKYAATYFVINGLDSRLRDDTEISDIRASDDPYLARRETYLDRRRREIAALKGEVLPDPDAEYDDLEETVADPVTPPDDGAAIMVPENPETVILTRPR